MQMNWEWKRLTGGFSYSMCWFFLFLQLICFLPCRTGLEFNSIPGLSVTCRIILEHILQIWFMGQVLLKYLPSLPTAVIYLCWFYEVILQAKLSVGDVVKCCIKKITYFGIFVEVIMPCFFFFSINWIFILRLFCKLI